VRAGAILKRARHHYGDRGARMAFFEGPAVRTGPADYVRHDPAFTPREQVSHGRTEPFAGVRRGRLSSAFDRNFRQVSQPSEAL